ncbi:MAG: sulfotransferase [Cyanothece sp. SIO2G6]|nr:sulfotransferase [Cyanothece sp. SIO2G6]
MELKFVICGLEHSGTTLVSDIFRQVENVDSGFECGVLLGNSPREFPDIQPFFTNMLGGWEIQADVLERTCATDSFLNFYSGVYEKSGFFKPGTKYIFDKTPRYFLHLFQCYEKVNVPFIATYKDPRAIVASDFKRAGKNQIFEEWYESYKISKLQYLSRIYDSYLEWKSGQNPNSTRIICVALEDICLNTRQTLEKMFLHVDLEFELRFLLLKRLRYAHTRVPQISSRIPFEYVDILNESQKQRVINDFAVLDSWFYF